MSPYVATIVGFLCGAAVMALGFVKLLRIALERNKDIRRWLRQMIESYERGEVCAIECCDDCGDLLLIVDSAGLCCCSRCRLFYVPVTDGTYVVEKKET